MAELMTIGDFSRATRLSAKALRFYHQEGLLPPAEVDPFNGYRRYSVEQIFQAQLIRQFRALEMPVEVVRAVLASPTLDARDELIAAHLARMEQQLEQTQAAVASLRNMLSPAEAQPAVSYRRLPPTWALVMRETIDLDHLGPWYTAANEELDHALASGLVESAGPRGGMWDTELFLDERGVGAVFVPVAEPPDTAVLTGGRARVERLPGVDLAVATHHGPDATIGEAYAMLGDHVTRHGLSADGPIREAYLQAADARGAAVTEIGWPIDRALLS